MGTSHLETSEVANEASVSLQRRVATLVAFRIDSSNTISQTMASSLPFFVGFAVMFLINYTVTYITYKLVSLCDC